jgi:8-oxo-dGTP diphosphatase
MELQVGVKALLRNKEGKFLFLRRSAKKYPEARPWDFPGGRINIGAPLLENLKREIKEETGLEILGQPMLIGAQDIIKPDLSKHVVRLTYIASVTEGVPELSDEHEEFAWLTLEEIGDREDVDKYIRMLLKEGRVLTHENN